MSGNNAPQVIGTPATYTWASAIMNCRSPPSPRRIDPTTTPSTPNTPNVSSIATPHTRCGLTSTKTPNPSPTRPRTASSNRTTSRKFRYQYPASKPPPPTTPPTTDDQNGTSPTP